MVAYRVFLMKNECDGWRQMFTCSTAEVMLNWHFLYIAGILLAGIKGTLKAIQ